MTNLIELMTKKEVGKKICNEVARLYEEENYMFNEETYYGYESLDTDDVYFESESEETITDEIYELNIDYICSQMRGCASDIISTACKNLKINSEIVFDDEDFLEELLEYAENYISVDYMSGLYRSTNLKLNIFPEQEDNADSEGSDMGYFLDAIAKILFKDEPYNICYMVDDISTFEDLRRDNLIEKSIDILFESQGYKLEDLLDEEKVRYSSFLSSFINELGNNYNMSSFLNFSINMGLEEFFKLASEKEAGNEISIVFDKTIMCGFFDPVFGSGSLLDIELEKPVTYKLNNAVIQVEGSKHNYGYSVDSVYGLIGSCWKDHYKIIKETEKVV